jgi:hypothetical protein
MNHREIIQALHIGAYHAELAASRARALQQINEERHVYGIAGEYKRSAEDADRSSAQLRALIERLESDKQATGA